MYASTQQPASVCLEADMDGMRHVLAMPAAQGSMLVTAGLKNDSQAEAQEW